MSLRIPLPSAPAGSVMQGALQTNALTKSNLENQILRTQSQYAPYSSYADTALKMAQAQVAAPQVLSNILSNPMGVSRMSPETYNALVSMTQRGLQNIGNMNVPQPGQMGGSVAGNAYNWLMNKIHGGAASSPQNNGPALQQAIANQTPGQAITIGANGQPIVSNDIGQNSYPGIPVPQSGSTVPQAGGGYNTPLTQNAASLQSPGTMGGINPSSAANAQSKGFETALTSQAQAITKQWADRQDAINDRAQAAQDMQRQLERIDDARSRLKFFEKGPILGRLPALTSAAIDSDVGSNNLVAAKMRAWQDARITNKDIDFGQMLKPGRYMPDDSYISSRNYEMGLSERLQEEPAFAVAAQNAGLNPAQSDAVWIRYANERPFYDPKSKQILSNNLNQWESYFTPESIKETFSPSFKSKMDAYKKNMVGGDPQQDKEISNQFKQIVQPTTQPILTAKQAIQQQSQNYQNQIIKMKGKDPQDGKIKIWNVPQGKAQLFIDNGFARAY